MPDMSNYEIIVTRSDGRLHPLAVKHPSFEAVCRQALRFAQNAAVHGCPLRDALPPQWVDIQDGLGNLVLRVTVDHSLRPRPESLA